MTDRHFTIDADALHAYADGRLGAAERADVEAYLAAHPEAAAEVAAWLRQNEALTALFPPIGAETTPPRLSPHALASELRKGRRNFWRNTAAAMVLVALGTGVGWSARDYFAPAEAASNRLIEDAVTAHALYTREKTRAVEVAAEAPNLMTWLSSRITTPVDAPDLSTEGYTFLGGRLLPSEPEAGVPAPAAQLMYENAAGLRVTLYITAALPDRKTAWEFAPKGAFQAYYWANESVTCTLVADLPEAQLRALGSRVFEQLTQRPEAEW